MGDGALDAQNFEEMNEKKGTVKEKSNDLEEQKAVPLMGVVKEISVEIKKSRNFQTYTAGMVITIEPETEAFYIQNLEEKSEDKIAEIQRYWQAKCRAKVMEQIRLDSKI